MAILALGLILLLIGLFTAFKILVTLGIIGLIVGGVLVAVGLVSSGGNGRRWL